MSPPTTISIITLRHIKIHHSMSILWTIIHVQLQSVNKNKITFVQLWRIFQIPNKTLRRTIWIFFFAVLSMAKFNAECMFSWCWLLSYLAGHGIRILWSHDISTDNAHYWSVHSRSIIMEDQLFHGITLRLEQHRVCYEQTFWTKCFHTISFRTNLNMHKIPIWRLTAISKNPN